MEGTSESEVLVPWQRDDEEEIPAWMDFPEEEIPEQEVKNGSGEKKMRRKMCIAWMIARKEILKHHQQGSRLLSGDSEIQEENRKVEERREGIKRIWAEFSAEEELRAGWKVSEMDTLTDLSVLLWEKKGSELEQSYAMKRQLKEARDKGLQPEKELEENYKNYLAFRNMWIATHSCWDGAFEDVTKIKSMGYTDDPVPRYVYNHGPPDTLQIFSIKVEGTSDGELCWPFHVFGLVAIRDSIDQNPNLVFNRQRYECQTLTKEIRCVS
ncbi:unnamed protein product [Urochloa humidicola]